MLAPTDRPSLGAGASTVPKNFAEATELHRPVIHAHCYRMLGSVHDADDLTQETYLRAWRKFDSFEGRASVRSWLYAIATRVCLDELAKRRSRSRWLPDQKTAATDEFPTGLPISEVPWLEAYPSADFENSAAGSPAEDAVRRDMLRIAFVAAVQRLSPRERAALLLDSLDFSAAESAEVIGLSLAAVNSALQRARKSLRVAKVLEHEANDALSSAELSVVDRYLHAWEGGDLQGVVKMLSEEVRLVMPPWIQWYQGQKSVRRFFNWAFDWAWSTPERTSFRFVPVRANGRLAFAMYLRSASAEHFHLHALQMVTVSNDRVTDIHIFLSEPLLRRFGVPVYLDR